MTNRSTKSAGAASQLILKLSSNVYPVSTLSATLRTLQAAVRDAASRTETGHQITESRPAPTLMTRIDGKDGRIQLHLFFAAPGGPPLQRVSQDAFCAFMEELAQALKSQPHRTLWGTRPRAREEQTSRRMKLFLDDVMRLGEVEVAACSRRVRITDAGIDINRP